MLDLGGYTLKFISAPNLHWPDSIFTWCEELKTLFTCDFLGCHYCGETDDTAIADENRYFTELERYYTYIFGPFSSAVRTGASIVKDHSPGIVCPSHGPVLKTNISKVTALYEGWAEETVKKDRISVFYVSAYGYTKTLAEALAKGAANGGAEVSVYEITGTDKGVIAEAIRTSAAYMFGSPTLNRDALPPVWDVLGMVSAVSDRNKPALMFGSYGWSGEACANLAERAKGIGLRVDEEPVRICFKPSEEEIAAAVAKGEAFAKALFA